MFFIYILYTLYTFYIHFIHIVCTSYTHFTYFLDTFWDTFWTCSGQVWESKKIFPRKFWGCLGCIWASSLVSKKGSRGSKKYVFFKKITQTKNVQICSESPPDRFDQHPCILFLQPLLSGVHHI